MLWPQLPLEYLNPMSFYFMDLKTLNLNNIVEQQARRLCVVISAGYRAGT